VTDISCGMPLIFFCLSKCVYESSCGFIYRPQMKAGIIWARWWCLSKPDFSDLLQISRWCWAIFRLEVCSKSTSHHLDSADLQGCRNCFGDKSHGGMLSMAECYASRWWWWW